jgi:hypothetical protein
MKQLTKFGLTIATFAIAATLYAQPTFAANKVTISGNSSNTTNTVILTDMTMNMQKQKNIQNVDVSSSIGGNTGGNTIKNVTTGGDMSDPSITTGNVKQKVDVSTTGGVNIGSGSPCGCQTPSNTIKISGNGGGSKNTASVNTMSMTSTSQKNISNVAVLSDLQGNTGGNKISNITGTGDNSISTGNVNQSVTVSVGGSVNSTSAL